MGLFSWFKKRLKGKDKTSQFPKDKKILNSLEAGKVKGGKSKKRIWNGCGGTIPQ